jgi:hypothetical protein
MIKLKNILREGYAWERKADGSLPTLADTSAAYAANMQEQVDDDAAEIKSYIKAITKLVAEVNELIGRAIDSDGDPLEITDPSSTWPSGKYYEPVTFENNVLTIKGHDVYSNKPEVDTYDINQAIQDPDSNYWQLTDSVDSLKYMRRKLKHAILRNSRKAPDIEEASKSSNTVNEEEIGMLPTNTEVLDLIDLIHNMIKRVKAADPELSKTLYTSVSKFVKTMHSIVDKNSETTIGEADKPDYIDADGDGNETESMKKAFKDKEAKNESINELSDDEIDARWNTNQQRWQRQFNTSQMANDMKSGNMSNSSKSAEKAPKDFYREKLAALKAQRKQIEFDMEQEAEPEGGPIADYYGDALMHVDAQIDDIMSKMHKNESAFVTKGGLQEMRELPLEQKILRNFKGTNFILSETFKK